jgi:hypothetical protein
MYLVLHLSTRTIVNNQLLIYNNGKHDKLTS